MSGNVYPVPESLARQGLDRRDQIRGDVHAARSRTRTGSGPSRPSASTGSSRPPRSRTRRFDAATSRSSGSRTACSTSRPIASTGILAKRGEQTAILWEGDDPKDSRNVTYASCTNEVCRFANVLKSLGVKKGDRVTIYMPMMPEAAVAMLACARIGAIHSVVFGGFSPKSLAGRIQDCDSNIVITADEGLRGGRKVPLKANVDEALEEMPDDQALHRAEAHRRQDRLASRAAMCGGTSCSPSNPPIARPSAMNAEDPLFILYTSGSTGKPKGVLHTTGGYLVYASLTHQIRVRLPRRRHLLVHGRRRLGDRPQLHRLRPARQRRDHADVRGRAELSDASRFWEVVDKHKVNIFYTAPTAIRALMREGEAIGQDEPAATSLRLLGSVGEPINPEAWQWYHRVVGERRCPIVDTWWQTETGGILITPLPGATALKPGSATRPLLRRQAASSSTATARCWTAPAPAISASPIAGPARCAPCTATTSASCRPISRPTRACTSPATAAGATRTAITGSPAASTT